MLLRISLWAMLIGSIIMGYLGYQTGSAMTTFIGMGAMIFLGFLLFFLAKMTLSAGLVFVKIVVIILLIGGLILLGVRGCSILMHKGKEAIQTVSVSLQNQENQGAEIPTQLSEKPSLFIKIKHFFVGSPQKKQVLPPPKSQQKNKLLHPQTLSGIVSKVISPTVFVINGIRLKLYGIDAPDLNQTCLNKRGETYRCGQKSQKMLEKLTLNKNVTCQLVQSIGKKQYLATCKIQGYDIGATMVSVGWAVADRRTSAVYIPYEQQAHQAHEGLWAGKFVAPWDFRTGSAQSSASQKSGGFLKGLLQ